MKTTKLIALALILGIASLGYAQTESPADQAPGNNGQSLVISLKKAMQSHDLVKAMHMQLNSSFLKVEKPLYTVPVRFKSNVYYIAGTYDEWNAFFLSDPSDGLAMAEYALIPFIKAIQIPDLVIAMRAQLTPALLQGDQAVYVAPVRYKHSIVYVSGTYGQWKKFFSSAAVDLPLD